MKQTISSPLLDNTLVFDLFQKKMRRVWKQVRAGVQPDSTDCQGFSLLHMAVFLGMRSLAAYLIEHGADVNAQSKGRFTPLHLAAHQANEQMIRLLLTHGARADLKDSHGRTPRAYMRSLRFAGREAEARTCMQLLQTSTHRPRLTPTVKRIVFGHTR